MRYIFSPYHIQQRLIRGLLSGAVIGIIFALLLNGDYFSTWRTSFKDSLYQGTNTTPTAGITTIIAIDDMSLAALGREPTFWSREAHADLLDILAENRAKAIAFDVIFAEPTDEDDRLIEAFEQAGQGVPGERLPTRIIQPVSGSQSTLRPLMQENRIVFDGFIYPTDAILSASTDRFGRLYTGHVNILTDDDGFVRKIPLSVADVEGNTLPALGLMTYIASLGISPEDVEYRDDAVVFADRTLYTDELGQMLIYFFDTPAESGKNFEHSFPVYSYIDVLCSYRPDGDYFLPGFDCANRENPIQVPPEAIQNQIVLIGVLGAVAVPDRFPVPISGSGQPMYGVEIHANVIENIHQALDTVGRKLPLVEQSQTSQMLVVFLVALFSGMILALLRWYVAFILVIVTYGIYFLAGVQFFRAQAVVIELLFPGAALVSVLFVVLISNYLFEERRRSQINDLFQRYVSPEIARRIVEISDRGELDLSGEEREITVMFADIRGFTTLSEGLPPAEVVALLNTFLERMNAAVLRHEGAINKYIGDNLMAFWNAPYTQQDHALKAVRAGIELLKEVDKLNATNRFSAPVQFGIGVNTGTAVVGNIGSSQRLEYTPIGDTVNVASRLSGAAEGGTMLVGAATYDAIKDHFQTSHSEELKLKGKSQPVLVYEFRASEMRD